MSKNPCGECPVHTSICHLLCRAYKEWNAKENANRIRIWKEKHANAEILSETVDRQYRQFKKRGNKKW